MQPNSIALKWPRRWPIMPFKFWVAMATLPNTRWNDCGAMPSCSKLVEGPINRIIKTWHEIYAEWDTTSCPKTKKEKTARYTEQKMPNNGMQQQQQQYRHYCNSFLKKYNQRNINTGKSGRLEGERERIQYRQIAPTD